MRRGLIITAIFLIVAWLLMLTCPIFTKTALTTVASALHASTPFFASSLSSNITVAFFVCSFAWMFVLSSVISGLIFGKQKRIFIQFLIGLVLTLTASQYLMGSKRLGLTCQIQTLCFPTRMPKFLAMRSSHFSFFLCPSFS